MPALRASFCLGRAAGFVLGGLVFLTSLLPSARLAAQEASPVLADWGPAVRATNGLGLRLLWEVQPGANSVLSPLALELGLAQLYAGSDGATRAEMRQVLRFPADEAELHRGFERLRDSFEALRRDGGGTFTQFQLVCASGLFLQQGFVPYAEWLTLLERHYGSRPQTVDFLRTPKVAAQALNSWMERQTQGRIRDIVPSAGLPNNTRLALLAALFYRAKWGHILQTLSPAPFRRPDAVPVVVPMMGTKARLPYRKFPTFTAVQLPFRTDFVLLVVLPDSIDGLPALERTLTPEIFEECREMPEVRVDLTLPPFRLATPLLDLRRPLLRLGLRSVFDDPKFSANLSKMAPLPKEDGEEMILALSEIWQRAEFQIDRFGAEGSAGNAMPPGTKRGALPMPPTPTPPPPVVVKVDHPFLFALRHRTSGATLFIGRVERLDESNAIRPAAALPTPTPADGNQEVIVDFEAPELEADPDVLPPEE